MASVTTAEGRSSARETVARVAAGAIAAQALDRMGISIYAFTRSVGDIELPSLTTLTIRL